MDSQKNENMDKPFTADEIKSIKEFLISLCTLLFTFLNEYCYPGPDKPAPKIFDGVGDKISAITAEFIAAHEDDIFYPDATDLYLLPKDDDAWWRWDDCYQTYIEKLAIHVSRSCLYDNIINISITYLSGCSMAEAELSIEHNKGKFTRIMEVLEVFLSNTDFCPNFSEFGKVPTPPDLSSVVASMIDLLLDTDTKPAREIPLA